MLCVAGAVLEAALLAALGPAGSSALAPQATAIAPLGVFHDLRWLLVYHRSWPGFAAETLALIVVRSALTAATVVLAWPEHLPRPCWRRTAVRSATYTVVAGLLLAPLVTLLFAMAVVSVSYLLLGVVPALLVVVACLHHGPVATWWRVSPTPRSIGWALASLVVLTAAGALIAVSPWEAAVPVAGLAGLFNARAWLGIVGAFAPTVAEDSVGATTARRLRPVAPLVLVGLSGLVLAVTALAGSSAPWLASSTIAASDLPQTGRPVLVLAGFGAGWAGQRQLHLGAGFAVRRFSYLGLAADGAPLHYGPADTLASVDVLSRRLGRQIAALRSSSGEPVTIVAASEGALVATAYLAAHPDAPVRTVVLLSPLVAPARVYFPPRGQSGRGVAAGAALRAVGTALHVATPLDIAPDAPLVRSIEDHARALRDIADCPLPGVRELALRPLADATAVPYGAGAAVPALVVPALHGRLLDSPATARTITTYLRTGLPPHSVGWAVAERVLGAAASGWQMPEFSIGANPLGRSSSTVGMSSCRVEAAALREWLG